MRVNCKGILMNISEINGGTYKENVVDCFLFGRMDKEIIIMLDTPTCRIRDSHVVPFEELQFLENTKEELRYRMIMSIASIGIKSFNHKTAASNE